MSSEYYLYANICRHLQYIKVASALKLRVKDKNFILDSINETIEDLGELSNKDLDNVMEALKGWQKHLNALYDLGQDIGRKDSQQLKYDAARYRDELLGYLKNYKPQTKEIIEEGVPDDKFSRQIKTIRNQISQYISTVNEGQSSLKEKIDKIENIISAGQSATQKFLITSVERKSIKTKICLMIQSVEKDDTLLICSSYLGTTLSEEIIKAIGKGVNIRILSRPLGKPNKEVKKGFSNLSKKLKTNMRTNNELHARFYLLKNKEGIITSADITSISLDTNFEAGIWTNNPVILMEMKDFFDKIWVESKELNSNNKRII